MRIVNFLFLISLLVPQLPQSAPSTPQLTPVTGTRVSLVPPVGFTPATQFSGFVQESMGASIMVTELTDSLSDLIAAFRDPAVMASRGMQLLDQKDGRVSNLPGSLFYIKQIASGIELRKWLLVFGDKDVVMITATFAVTLEAELSEKMKASLLTATWDRDKKISPTEGLNFAITENGDIRLAKRMANALLYTKEGAFPIKSIDEPLFIVSPAITAVFIENRERFAKLRLLQTDTVKDIRVETIDQITIDGLNGYELSAKAADSRTDAPMVVYQVILFDDQTYYLMQGLVSSKGAQTYAAVFKELAKSFKLKRPWSALCRP